jgi:hypothetical protein
MPKFFKTISVSPLPERLSLTVTELTFTKTKSRKKDINRIQPDVFDKKYKVELSHGLDLAWRPLNFFNFNYRISLNRNFDDLHREFARERFFSGAGYGLLAHRLILSLDTLSKKPLDSDKPETYKVYTILAHERNRNQNFQMDFNPQLISWIPTGIKFNSGYNHTRSAESSHKGSTTGEKIPEHFDAGSNHDIRFNTGLRISSLFADLKDITKPVKWLSSGIDKTKKGIDKLKLRNIDANYSISHNYNGEEFTLKSLNKVPVSPLSFFAYQMGFVYDPSIFYNLKDFKTQVILGQPDPDFMDYLSWPMVMESPTSMSHSINRTADLRSGFTVPLIDLNLTGTMKWSKKYVLSRDFSLAHSKDTSVTWPDFSINGRFSDFIRKISFLKKRFRTFSVSSSYNYEKQRRFNLLSSRYDNVTRSHKFNPLFKVSATSKKNIRYENNINQNLSISRDLHKEITPFDTVSIRTYFGDTTVPAFKRGDEVSETESFGISDVFTVSYDVQTKKGVQFWRWYIKLENNLRLKATAEAGWNQKIRTVTKAGEPERTPEQEELRFKIRPEVSYNFTRKMDAMFYAQYLREQDFHTADEDVTHEIEIHGEFTMRF